MPSFYVIFLFFLALAGVWVASVTVALIIADQKKLHMGKALLLTLATGPIGIFILLSKPSHNMTNQKNSQGSIGLQDAERELNNLRKVFLSLEQRINALEKSIVGLGGLKVSPQPTPEMQQDSSQKVEIPAPAPVLPGEKSASPQSADMELAFGRNWLNKIGIIVFTLGMGFLISYTFKYFGAFLKIAFGYAISLALFFIGFKLEAQKKYINFGRVVLGGAWALVYFTTFAMHHFETSRIIQSQLVDLVLLGIVVVGMMAHVLKYKSESMMSVTLIIAYLTSTLGNISGFTIMSSMFLAALVLFLVYRFQWVQTFVLGVMFTYFIHIIWIMPKITSSVRHETLLGFSGADYQLVTNFLLLTIYWVVFLAGVHLAKTCKEDRHIRTLAAVNFGNISLYSIFAYPIINTLWFSHRFSIVLCVGFVYLFFALIMKKNGRERFYISDIIAAVFVLTLSIPLKFSVSSTLLVWFIEVPFLLYIGIANKDKTLRYMGYILSICAGVRFLYLYSWGGMSDVRFLGFSWVWHDFMSLWAALSMASCFSLTQQARKSSLFEPGESVFDHFFSAAACLYSTTLLLSAVRQPWVSCMLSVEGFILLAISFIFVLRRFRVYAYILLILSAMNFLSEHIFVALASLQWLIIGFDVAMFFIVYWIIKDFARTKRITLFFDREGGIVFWAGVVLLTSAVFQYAQTQWVSLSLGIASAVMIFLGILQQDKTVRLGGLLLLGLTLIRVVFVDLAGLDTIFRIITFIVLGILFLGVSFLYSRFNIDKDKSRDSKASSH